MNEKTVFFIENYITAEYIEYSSAKITILDGNKLFEEENIVQDSDFQGYWCKICNSYFNEDIEKHVKIHLNKNQNKNF